MADGHDEKARDFDTNDSPEAKTVRILPDDAPDADSDLTARSGERRGTLYSPYSQQASTSSLEPYEPTARRRSTARQEPVKEAEPRASSSQPTAVTVRRGPSACAIMAITFSLLAIACAVLAFGTVREGLDGFGKLTGIIPNFSFVTTPTVTIDTSSPTIVNSVRSLSRLETVQYEMEKVVTGQSSGPLPDFLTGDRILLVAHGQVAAGIDLGKIGPEDITVEGERVTIAIPKPEILYSRLDNDKTYVYDRQTGVFSKPDPNLETQIRQAAEQQIRMAALEDGILDKAAQNGEDVIRTLVTGLGYKEVEFKEQP